MTGSGEGLFDEPEAAEESGGSCCDAPAAITIGAATVSTGGC
ncbi:hypothetical protein [Streptomyces sp. SPB4]|nr:hypothetical protein [Streptomyces sp. SPB4]MDH6537837.1 hypothetical protein [Streptomyces sp. SPB4]